eukprot:9421251-Pyramimonas_sp.AAC.1
MAKCFLKATLECGAPGRLLVRGGWSCLASWPPTSWRLGGRRSCGRGARRRCVGCCAGCCCRSVSEGS